MLSNRFLRLLTSILISAGLFILIFLIFPNFCSNPNIGGSNIFEMYVAVFVFTIGAGLIYQIIGDILNVSILDNDFGVVLKRIIFIGVTLFTMLLSIMAIDRFDRPSDVDPDMFSIILSFAGIISPGLNSFAWLITTSKDVDVEFTPFFTPISIVASFILSIILCLIFPNLETLKTVLIIILVANIVIMGIYRFKVGGAFEEFGDSSLGDFYVGLSGGTSGSSYSSGSNYSNDNRKHDGIIFNKLSMSMHCIANQYSKSISHGDCYINVTVYVSVIGNTVEFRVNGKYSLGSSTLGNGEYAINNELENLKHEYLSLKNEIKQEANYVINDLRKDYSDYDTKIKVEVILNNPTRW